MKLLSCFRSLKCLAVGVSRPSSEVVTAYMDCHLSNLTDLYLKNVEQLLHHLVSINLTNLHFIGNIKVLADSLKYCQNLKELNLNGNNITEKDSKLLAKSLKNCTSLKELNISNTNISSTGLGKILESTRHFKLRLKAACHRWDRSFTLSANLHGLDIKVNMDDSELFFKSIRNCIMLKELHVAFVHRGLSKVTVDYAYYLEELKELQAFTLTDGIGNIEAVTSLMNGLKHSPNLQKLDLSNNYLCHDEIEVMAAHLKDFARLKKLYLDRTVLGEGVEAISSYFQDYQSLQELSLGYNNIRGKSAIALASKLQSCHSLQKLNLQHNNIDDEAASVIVTSLKHCASFQALDISDNPCDPNIWERVCASNL